MNFILSIVVLVVASFVHPFYSIPMSRWMKWSIFGMAAALNFTSIIPAVKWLEPVSIILMVVFILSNEKSTTPKSEEV